MVVSRLLLARVLPILAVLAIGACAAPVTPGPGSPSPVAPTPAPAGPTLTPRSASPALPTASPATPAPIATPTPAVTPPPGATPLPSATWEPAPPRPTAAPVAPDITPISRSAPSKAGRVALTVCGAYRRGLDSVDRAGLVRHVRDLPKYMPMSPRTPDLVLRPDEPAWVVQFTGEFPDRMIGQSWIDETCVVIRGGPGFYATGPVRDLATGRIVRGYYVASPAPIWSLPTLAP